MLRHIHNTMHIETDLLAVRAPMLIAETIRILSVLGSIETIVPRRHRALMDLEVAVRLLDPVVDVQVSAPAKFPVPDLERHGHFVIFVQRLVKAFAGVCFEEDVVRVAEGGAREEREDEEEEVEE